MGEVINTHMQTINTRDRRTAPRRTSRQGNQKVLAKLRAMKKNGGHIAVNKHGEPVVVPAVPTDPEVRQVRRGSRDEKYVHRGTSFLPNEGQRKNIYYWPGFGLKKSRSPIPPIVTNLKPIGPVLERQPEYFTKLVEPPLSPRRKFEFPGTRQRIGPPPVEPGAQWPAVVKRPVVHVRQEVPAGALGEYGIPQGVSQYSIFLSDGTVASELDVVKQVEQTKASMPAAEAAGVDWGAATMRALAAFRDQYAKGLEVRRDVIDKQVYPPQPSRDMKPLLYALGLGIAGFFLFREGVKRYA